MMKKIIIIYFLLNKIIYGSIAQQIDLNLSFEKLDTNGLVYGWQVSRRAIPISDAYDGRYAIKIFTNYINLPDYLKIGSFNDKEARGIPYKEKPQKLKGYYKYEYGNNCGGKDSAEVYIYLKKYNLVSNKPDTIGKGKLYLGPTSTYKLFELPVIYSSTVEPDSLSIEFYTQKFDKTVACTVSENRYFTIDALSLDFATLTDDVTTLQSPVYIYPNPATNDVHIDWGKNAISDVILKDTLGHVMQKKATHTEGVILDLSALPKGLYFIEFSQNGKHIATRKVVKQ